MFNFGKIFQKAPGPKEAMMTVAMFLAAEGMAAGNGDLTSLGQQAKSSYSSLDQLDKNGFSIENKGKKVFENKGTERSYSVLNKDGSVDYFLVDLDGDGNIDKMRFADGEIDFKNDPNYQPGGKNFGVRVSAQTKYTEGLQLVLNVEKAKELKAAQEQQAKGADASASVK